MQGLCARSARPDPNVPMTTLPAEINPDAVKNSAAEKVTPMMAQYIGGLK